MRGGSQDNPGVMAPPPLIFLAALVAGLLIQRAFPMPFLAAPWARAAGVLLVAAAFALAGSAARMMRRAGTNIDPRKPATTLVVDGPFRFTRNPLYLSLTLLYGGISCLANALWPLVLLPGVLAMIRYGVIAREERYLERKFGEAYLRYKASVRRWV